MFIIFGFRGVARTTDTGVFFCSNEGGDRSYRLRKVRRFFTLFFIPLIPLNELGEYVECETCHVKFNRTVLDRPTSADMQVQLTAAVRTLVVAVLRASGISSPPQRQAALNLLGQHSGVEVGDDHLDYDLATIDPAQLSAQLAPLATTLNEHGREAMVRSAVELAAADGNVSDAELEVAYSTAAAMQLTHAHARGVIEDTVEAIRASGQL